MDYGYARVSAQDQNLTRQLVAFKEFGIAEAQIYCDKKSGKNFNRGAYLKLVRKLKSGDLLVIKSIDRLGRNYKQIIDEWRRLTEKIGANILVLDMPILDTRERKETLVGKFISDVVLQVLSFVAENERANIRTRQAEGIAAAKSKGIRFGRPSFTPTTFFLQTVVAYRHKRIPLKEALRLLGMKKENFYYHLRRNPQWFADDDTTCSSN